MKRRTLIGITAVCALIALVFGSQAYSATPVTYTPPCTANTDACRQQRIVALETNAAQMATRIQALETPTPTASPTTPPATTTVPPTTAPPTTTVPPTTPPAQVGWPDASNTGVPAGVTLAAYTGPSTITVANTVISEKLITDCLVVNAANVTIERSKVSCAPGRDGTAVVSNSTGLKLTDVEVDGNPNDIAGSSCGIAVGYDHFELSRVRVHGCSDGLRASGVVTVVDSYIGPLWASGADHADGVQAYLGAGDMTFRHNSIDARTQDRCCENGALFFADGYDGTVTLDNNWIAGGNFSLRLHESGKYIVTGNRVLAGSYNFGPVTTVNGIIQTWSNNREISASGVDGAVIEP